MCAPGFVLLASSMRLLVGASILSGQRHGVVAHLCNTVAIGVLGEARVTFLLHHVLNICYGYNVCWARQLSTRH